MKIDLPELERKLSYGINLTIKESTILLESMEGFIDDKIELQEQLNTAKKYIEESYKADKEDNKLLDLIIEDVAKLKSDNETAKKALTEISKTKDFYRSGRDHWEEFSQDALKAQKALAAIGWDGCPAGPIGKNGLTKEELEGSGDE